MNGDAPKWLEIPIKIGDFAVPLFQETSISKGAENTSARKNISNAPCMETKDEEFCG